jgi:Uma2 family endonuclease
MTTVLQPLETATQKVILHNISWKTYERLLAEHPESNTTRFAYDRGTLEIMILSPRHEKLKDRLMTLVGVLAEALQLDIEGVGSTTFRREDLARGFEPDASYYLTHAALIRPKDEIDLSIDPPPELVIEVDITHPSLEKFPIFAAFGVAEVWRWDGTQVQIFRLAGNEYAAVQESAALPSVTGALVTHLLEAAKTLKRGDWLRLVRESVPKDSRQ